MSTYVFEKHPDALEDFTVNWLDLLGSDTISTSIWTIPSGVTNVNDTNTTTTTTVWLSGGTLGENYVLENEITTAGGRTEKKYIVILVKQHSNLAYLIPYVRLRIGDTNNLDRRYLDQWIEKSLILSIIKLGKWWNYKYLLDSEQSIYRNPNFNNFIINSPPILEGSDEDSVVLMASIIILEGSLESSAWNFGSWRDAEIAFSNIESSKSRNKTLDRMWEELLATLKPPTKRLARTIKGSLPGYLDNLYEIGEE